MIQMLPDMTQYSMLLDEHITTYCIGSCQVTFESSYTLTYNNILYWVMSGNIWIILDRPFAYSGKVCQWLTTGWWFSPGSPVSSTNKSDHHDMTEILLKVGLNTIKQIVYNIIKYIDKSDNSS
jgi:hypothetical protein